MTAFAGILSPEDSILTAFRSQIQGGDDLAIKIYADWLEEQGKPESEFVRSFNMSTEEIQENLFFKKLFHHCVDYSVYNFHYLDTVFQIIATNHYPSFMRQYTMNTRSGPVVYNQGTMEPEELEVTFVFRGREYTLDYFRINDEEPRLTRICCKEHGKDNSL